MLLAKGLTNPVSGKIILQCIGASQHIKEICNVYFPKVSTKISDNIKPQYNIKKSQIENMTDKEYFDKYFK